MGFGEGIFETNFADCLFGTLGQLRHRFLLLSRLDVATMGTGILFCFCGERNEVYDEHEAKVVCFMESIAGWLVKVKALTGYDSIVNSAKRQRWEQRVSFATFFLLEDCKRTP